MSIESHINCLMNNVYDFSSRAKENRDSYKGDIMRAYYEGEMLGYERALELVRIFRRALFEDMEDKK